MAGKPSAQAPNPPFNAAQAAKQRQRKPRRNKSARARKAASGALEGQMASLAVKPEDNPRQVSNGSVERGN